MRRLLLATALGLVATAALAQDQKQLNWTRWDTTAELDSIGRLHVHERHVMVFTGDWNGGQRGFVLNGDQRMTFNGLTAVEGGTTHRMWRGPTRFVGFYDWFGVNTLRWRNRHVDDPPFNNTEKTYEIDYTLTNVLQQVGEHDYQLRHIFVPDDRPGGITAGTVALSIDPIWRNLNNVPTGYAFHDLGAGSPVAVSMRLRYLGSGVPRGAGDDVLPRTRILQSLFLVAPIVLVLLFVWHERRRLSPVVVDDAWVEANMLTHPAEVIGALWDRKVDAPEVAALLARLEQERKISTQVTRSGGDSDLHMKLLVDRKTLPDHERELIDALFFDDAAETSTSAIRAHYQLKGFDPADKIRTALTNMANEIAAGPRNSDPSATPSIVKWLKFIGIVLFWWGGVSSITLDVPNALKPFSAFFFFGLVLYLLLEIALKNAAVTSSTNPKRFWTTLGFVIPLAILAILFARLATNVTWIDPLAEWGAAIVLLTTWFNVLRSGETRESQASFDFRRRLGAERERLAETLRTRGDVEPRLFPYALAFGLSRDVDHWFAARATSSGAIITSPSMLASSSSTSTESSLGASDSPSTFGAGGGGFGGAGASGSWAAAVSSIATGVSAPVSSGSGGGWSSSGGGGSSSSGGGGSSGGGSAGGW